MIKTFKNEQYLELLNRALMLHHPLNFLVHVSMSITMGTLDSRKL